MRDLYADLEVDQAASADDIKRAYRRLTLLWHPDRFPDDPVGQAAAEKRFKQVSAAYQVLSDADLRRSYDAARLPGGAHTERVREFMGRVFAKMWLDICADMPELKQFAGAVRDRNWWEIGKQGFGLAERFFRK